MAQETHHQATVHTRRLPPPSRLLLLIGVSVLFAAGVLWLVGTFWQAGHAGQWDLSKHSVPQDQIISGGPGKDGIPAILHPRFISANEAGFLTPEDRLLGLARESEAKAYPIRILNWHEIVNDTIADQPVVVTYCPLCGTGIGFQAHVQGRRHTFGVSGLLYQSDLLMYDHQTESLWSQIAMEAVAGPLTGAKLTPIFLEHTTWADWRTRHPDTLVLSTKTGFVRDYTRDPYLGYAERPDLYFDVKFIDPEYPMKEWILGLEVNGVAKAYALSDLATVTTPFADRVNGQDLRIHFNPDGRSAWITDMNGRPLPSVMAFWFAWYTFHPDTLIFKPGR